VSDDPRETAGPSGPVGGPAGGHGAEHHVPLDLGRPVKIHVVGIGGAGMSAIATVLATMGHRVTGSDLKASAGLERLRSRGVSAVVGHHASNLGDADFVTVSSAIPADNPEVAEAARRGIQVLRRAEALAAITATRRTVAVAGTHGKTTVSSMLALVLVEAGLHPSFIIGGDINEVGSGAAWSDGEWLVVEADESDGTFLHLAPEVAIVTNVEPDHLDFYGDLSHLEDAFSQFLAGAASARIVCADDAAASRLGRQVDATTYGLTHGADYRMTELVTRRSSSQFTAEHAGVPLGRITLAVPGAHNARNACGALVAGLAIGASFDDARRALERYGGVARRFEFRGEGAGVTFVDDYAHLPTEVRAALAAAKDGQWQRVVAVFQPHRYSRTAALWADFADAFVDADVLVVTDIYSAGEAPRPGVSGRLIVDAVAGSHPDQDAVYLASHQELVAHLRRILRPGDFCLTLGAGDLTVLPDELLGEPG
jgi:UDP-N-acetylmuramate--alanine ligase